jgi:hypothetical protein
MMRRDYVNLAAGLKSALEECPAHGCPELGAGILVAVDAVADVLADDNPRFDRDTFLDACGPWADRDR